MYEMRNILVLSILLFFVSSNLSAQNRDKIPFSERIYFGGGFGLIFGDITNIEVSPHVGYKITEDASVGVQLQYQFLNADYYYYGAHFKYQTTIYGAGPFARYMLGDRYFLMSELEFLSLEKKYFDVMNFYEDDNGRFVYTSVLVGGGIFQQTGDRSGVYMALLYNINDSSNSPYSSPLIFRMGFSF